MKGNSSRIIISRDAEVLRLLDREYDSLLRRADWINPYFSPEWLSSWWKRQDKTRAPLLLLAYSEDGSLAGYWPFVERPGLLGSKGLWPFVYDEANYHFPTCASSVAASLVDALYQLLDTFLFVWIPLVPDSFWGKFIEAKTEDRRRLKIIRRGLSSRLIEPSTDQSFDEFWHKKLGSKSRKSLRSDSRGLARLGRVEYETICSFEEARSAMPATCVVEVGSKKTLENAGLYSIRGKRGFFFELLPRLAKREQARLSFLRLDDHPIAWQLELLRPGGSLLHHLAYDQQWKRYSPGKQLLKHSLKRCWEEGRTLDFLPARFAYKDSYANSSMPAHELHWIRKSWRGRIARKLIGWNMEWRRRLRERSPGLAASIARAEVNQSNSENSK